MGYWNSLDDEVARIIAFGQLEAREFGTHEVSNVTLFLGILRVAESDAAKLLFASGITYVLAKPAAARFFRNQEEAGIVSRLKKTVGDLSIDIFGMPLAVPVNRTMEIAFERAQSATTLILPEYVLLSLIQQRDPEVMSLLGKLAVDVKRLNTKLQELVESKAQYGQ